MFDLFKQELNLYLDWQCHIGSDFGECSKKKNHCAAGEPGGVKSSLVGSRGEVPENFGYSAF